MIKIISINIERSKHKDTVSNFLMDNSAGVVCLQEVYEEDLLFFQNILKMSYFFKPMFFYKESPEAEKKILGVAMFTNFKADFNYYYVHGDDQNIPDYLKSSNPLTERNNANIVLIWAEFFVANKKYKIATTHLSVTPDGQTTLYQMNEIKNLVSFLNEKLQQFILIGDFNAPRGRESFSYLAQNYKDNIPFEYDSSLDPNLHRVSGLKKMVDGLFTTSEYQAFDVSLIEGVSDHKAIIGCLTTNLLS